MSNNNFVCLKRSGLGAGIAFVLLLVSSCQTTDVTHGEGADIAEAQAERYDGPKARIAVGPIVDKSGDAEKSSLRANLRRLHKDDKRYESVNTNSVLAGMRDMLTTALFQSNRYIVLERQDISDALVEQDFAQDAKIAKGTRIPVGEIEGAELLVVGALTGFKPAYKGGGIPVPIPLNRNYSDFAIINLGMSKSFVSMDVRVIDVRSGRILSTVAVEGTSWYTSAELAGVAGKHTGHGYVRLPGLIGAFSNTPVEKAINEMVDTAVDEIVKNTPAEYRRFP